MSSQICFYMTSAGFACACHFRDKLKHGIYNTVSHVIWPLFAALFMVFIALDSIPVRYRDECLGGGG